LCTLLHGIYKFGPYGPCSAGSTNSGLIYFGDRETMYHPTLGEVQALAAGLKTDGRRPLLPLCYDLLADTETPVSAYYKAACGPYSFLLESVAGGERIARYSFIGIDPYLVLTHRGETVTLRYLSFVGGTMREEHVEEISCYDPLEAIQAELGRYYL